MNISLDSIINIDSEIVYRTNKDGTVVVMKMDNDDKFYKITGVAAEMWHQFSKNDKPLNKIINDLSNVYEVPREQILTDAKDFLEKIHNLKLVTTS